MADVLLSVRERPPEYLLRLEAAEVTWDIGPTARGPLTLRCGCASPGVAFVTYRQRCRRCGWPLLTDAQQAAVRLSVPPGRLPPRADFQEEIVAALSGSGMKQHHRGRRP